MAPLLPLLSLLLSLPGCLSKVNVHTLSYSTYPTRRNSMAAVLEWGHSAKISAIDAVSSEFGVRPGEGARFEVEAEPVLAEPLGMMRENEKYVDDVGGGGAIDTINTINSNNTRSLG